ncbi:MAG: tRNA (N(6)-L-threonylcarbamoyladenosine(37)-C(2))-methylthiotransferase MtaB [Clostridia bacterium]|nr:tRNA (N(6)-L-threonylcarbamoyladenosine(37)-C(2))-methylthiotransferase MtaB [Clostridia bacterium]
MYTVGIYTLGCKVAQYESEAIGEELERLGASLGDFNGLCDAYVINTCTVTAESDRKSRQMIRRAIKRNPAAIVAVVGCYSERAAEEISKIDGVSLVQGTDGKLAVAKRIFDLLDGRGASGIFKHPLGEAFEKMKISRAPRSRAYIKIEDGCESRCSYCAIRLARGRVRSKLPQDVIREALGLSASGVNEIVLTGIETGAYGKDFDIPYTLGDLIRELDETGKVKRLRLGSLAPELVGRAFAEKIKDVKILTPHFHISMQSGSDAVLNRMKRKYNSKTAFENIERLRAVFPTAEFTTDMMVGFPGETEEDFNESLDFIGRVGFLDVHVFSYSRRRGTEAAGYENQIPEDVKSARSRRMIEYKNKIRDGRLSLLLEKAEPLSVIAETKLKDGSYSSHADNFAEIIFKPKADGDLRGEFVKVIPVSHKNGIIYAEEI